VKRAITTDRDGSPRGRLEFWLPVLFFYYPDLILLKKFSKEAIMKKLFILLVFIISSTPFIAFADGKTDFNANCVMCHGGDARTNAKRAIMLKIDPKKLYLNASEMNKAEMIAITKTGKDKMPAFENKLTEDQIKGVVDYIKGLSKK
jgi:cytochrome c5